MIKMYSVDQLFVVRDYHCAAFLLHFEQLVRAAACLWVIFLVSTYRFVWL